MTTQQHATLNLQTNDVLKLFNKNDLSIESTKQLLSERKPYDTKIYSHSRSRRYIFCNLHFYYINIYLYT